MLERNDFQHEPGGLSPNQVVISLAVNEAGQLSTVSFNIGNFTNINSFNTRFFSWLEEAHPEEAALMGGPPGRAVLSAETAAIALRYVDDFVAQSDVYPINP